MLFINMILKKQITLGKHKYLVVDLTRPLQLDTNIYPGDPQPAKIIFSDISKTGWQHHTYKLGDHVFQPHGAAPNHQNKDLQDRGFEVFDLDWSFHDACLIDLLSSAEVNVGERVIYVQVITKEHLIPFALQLSTSGAVILRTGYDRCLEQNKKHVPQCLPYLQMDTPP